MKNQFREVRKTEYRIYWAIVAICGFVLAFGLCLAVKRYFHFSFHDDSGVVGWVKVNKYPKQQEIFYYITALIGVPFFTAVCWGLWLTYSTGISALIRRPFGCILKQDSFTYLPFLLALFYLPAPDRASLRMLWMPILLALAMKLVFFCYNFISFRVIGGKKRQESANGKVRRSIPIEVRSSKLTQRFRFHFDAGGNVLAASLCIGFYLLIAYPPDVVKTWYCVKILLLTVFCVFAFWGIYCLLISLAFHRRFFKVLTHDAYSYIPAVLLLLTSVFYPRGQVILPIVAALALISVKLLYLAIPHQFDKLQKKSLSKHLLSYLMIPALLYVFLYSGGNIHGWIDLYHEGERLGPLNELLRGGIPFRDVYIQHGLFFNAYRPLLASKLFGEKLAAVRFLEGLFSPSVYVCVYLLGLQVFSKRLTALLIVLINFWVIDRFSLGLISIALIASYVTKKKGWKLVSSGVCTTFAFFYSTEVGLYTFATCVLFLLLFEFTKKKVSFKKRSLPLFCYGVGVFLCFLPFAVYFGVHGALDDLIRNSYIQCRYQILAWGLPFPPLPNKELINDEQVIVAKWQWSNANQRSYFLGIGPYAGLYRPRILKMLLSTDGTGSGTTALKSESKVPIGKWTHVAAVWDGSEMRLYISGELDGTPVAFEGPVFQSTAFLEFGTQDKGKHSFFNGLMDEVGIANTALSQAEIKSVMKMGIVSASAASTKLAKAFSGIWTMDEGEGNKIKDSSSNGNDGELMNGLGLADGKFGKALSFDGEDDFVKVPDSDSLDITDAITIMAWIKPMKDPNFKRFILNGTFRWYLPILLYLIAATYLLHRALQGVFWTECHNAKLLLLSLFGITLFRTALGRSDLAHITLGSTMMWFIWLFFLEEGILWVFTAWRRALFYSNRHWFALPNCIIKAFCVLIPLIFFLWFVFSIHHPIDAAEGRLKSLTQYWKIRRGVPQTLQRAGPIQLPADQVAQIQKVVAYIQSHTDAHDTIFDFSNQGAYYFFANRPSATRYHQVAYAVTKSMQQEVIRALESAHTKLIIFCTAKDRNASLELLPDGSEWWWDNIDGIESAKRYPFINQYLEANYEEAANINGTIILRRKTNEPETR